ncbi:Sb-PDE family phosphodiesterase [Phenylobacterium sp.]|jgi:hypothetical protein|uniref:Sb-PDE family phosphodiesterase n=1 Tax=Phenylobacterium sp. TaxID=1871053 RepID=UPI0037CB4596
MRIWWMGVAAAVALVGAATAHEGKHDARRMVFPAAVSGGKILAVDLHTHSVFSDGEVWPTIRVEEARRDGLAAMAVTEHIEYQPHAADIPHPDRNRSFNLAREAAKDDLLIIAGAEITRDMPPGHINAVFITDANALRRDNVEESVRTANAQGGFVFWNHPYWHRQAPDGVARLMPLHQRLIANKQMHGIEVANGADYSESAFRIALDNNLAIIGTSDIHGLIDWDYDIPRGHRTVTLVVAPDSSAASIRAALQANRTVAWYRDSLIGRPPMVEEVVRSTLTLTAGDVVEKSKVLAVTLKNASPVRYTVRLRSPQAFYNAADIVTVSPYGETKLEVTGGVTPQTLALELEVLNTLVAPRQPLSLTLRPAAR